jgi:molybdenum cofactor biosynthesis protein B
MGAEQHRQQARQPVCCAVLTVSDTRTEATDTSGRAMREALAQAGHTVAFYTIVKDEPTEIRRLISSLGQAGQFQAVLLNGGTGISRRDSTYEAIVGLLDKRLEGFGELFRMLSYQEIGPAAMLSRAVAGTVGNMVVFCTPGSTGAVRLAMEKLILPELSHMVWELWRQQPPPG